MIVPHIKKSIKKDLFQKNGSAVPKYVTDEIIVLSKCYMGY